MSMITNLTRMTHSSPHLPIDVITAIDEDDETNAKAIYPMLGSAVPDVTDPIPQALLRPWDEYAYHKQLVALVNNPGSWEKINLRRKDLIPCILDF